MDVEVDEESNYRLMTKDPKNWGKLKNRSRAEQNIEMIPYGLPHFDIFSLEELCIFLQEDYFALPITRLTSKSKYYFYIFKNSILENELKMDPNVWSFYIVIEIPSFTIQVFIRYSLKDFSFCQDTINQYVEIHKSHKSSRGQHEKVTPHQVLISFCCNRNHPCPDGIRRYFQYQNSSYFSSRQYQTNKERNDEIENILRECPGDVYAEFITEGDGNNENSTLHKVSIVFPWAKCYFHLAHYLELDASFTAMKPYAFCVAQGIIFNESIPLSITITPSESNELYETTLDRFDEVFQRELQVYYQKINWKKKVVLSDMGKAICSICQKYEIMHFFCHRHILEHFGSASALGFIVQQILYCFSQDNCKELILKLQCQVDEYIRVITKLYGAVSKHLRNKLDEIKTMMMLEEGDKDSNYYFEKWALWIRSQYSVPRCSNHNESLHRALNQKTNSSEIIVTKLHKLINNVIRHYTLLPKRVGSSIDRKMNDNIRLLQDKLKNPSFDVLAYTAQYNNHPCCCKEAEYNSKIYGCYIPCRHSLLTAAYPFLLKFCEHLQKLDCQDQLNKYLNIILSNLKSTPKHILDLLELPQNELADQLMAQIGLILGTFRVIKPRFPFVSVDWKCHHYERKNIPAKKSSPDTEAEDFSPVDSQASPFIQDVPISLIYQHPEISTNENLAFQALLETANHIRKVHSSMNYTNCIMPLCLGVYEAKKGHTPIPQEKEAFSQWCAEFTMECFLRADQLNFFNHPGSKRNCYKIFRNE